MVLRRSVNRIVSPLVAAGVVILTAGRVLAIPSGTPAQKCGCHFPAAVPTTAVCIEKLPDDKQYDRSKPGGYPIKILINGVVVRQDGGDPKAPMAGFSLKVSAGTLEVDPLDFGKAQLNPNDPTDATVATHTSAGNVQTEWNLIWKPDPTSTTTTFTLTGIAVNGDGEDSGDLWNNQTFQFTASSAPSATPGRQCSNPAIPAPIYIPDLAP